MNKKIILMILDGWGKSPDPKVSAIDHAKTPFIDSLYTKYPNATLRTDGLHVGLPKGQMGNSEVGHMNLGAGRIVYQDLAKINTAVRNKTLGKEKVLTSAFAYAKKNNKNLHFLGLISNGGVHSHSNHLKGLVDAANAFGVPHSYVHAFTDGRDVDPKSGIQDIADLEKYIAKTNTKLATITGRYYAMDRDTRWKRIQLAYNALVHSMGKKTSNAIEAIQQSYDASVTDEFIKPIVLTNSENQPITSIKDGDVVVFFNFRSDRARELTSVLTQKDLHEYNMHTLDLHFVTMTNYDTSFKNIHVIFEKENLTKTLGEVLESNHKKQLRIAETEKYPHVTYFFSGGREAPFKGETRILRNSPKIATYDLQPAMSAPEITEALVLELEKRDLDFVCLNFANGDMVGHTGVMKAAIEACEVVDACVKDIITTALDNDYTTILIADHGNCETMINPDGTPNTAHTTNPVPIILIDKDIKEIKSGVLSDVAPTILKLMHIEQPTEMTQKPLI